MTAAGKGARFGGHVATLAWKVKLGSKRIIQAEFPHKRTMEATWFLAPLSPP